MQKQAAVWALAVTQTLGYVCLYYLFAALVVDWRADLGWREAKLALGPTGAIAIAGCLAPVVGRLIDRGWSRAVLSGGSLLGAGGLVLLALSHSYVGYLTAWAVIGAAQALVLYEACFAFLIRRLGPEARQAIIRVTLVAGFASTIAFPAAAHLADVFDWRGAVWAAAGAVLLINLPLNLWATTVLRQGEVTPSAQDNTVARNAARAALRSPLFWLLGLVLALLSLNHWMLIAFVIPVFTDQGAAEGLAVTAAAVVGPAQVVGRLALLRYEARAKNATVLWLCIAGMGAGTATLWLAGAAPLLVLGFATIQGATIGIMTIQRPVLIVDVLGSEGYGAIAGSLQVMPLMAGAAAPLLGGVLYGAGGAPAVIGASAAVLICAVGLTTVLRRQMSA